MTASMSLAERIAAAKAGVPAVVVPAVVAPVVVAPTTVVQPAGAGAGLIAGAQPAPGSLAAAIAKTGAVAGAQPTPAAAAATPLGGGSRLQLVRDALKTASVKSGRNDLLIGTGIYLLKSGKLFVTTGQLNISTFSLLCLQGIRDGAGNVYGVEGYTGPIPGETYDESLFQNFEPKRVAATMANNLRAVTACMGWTEDQVKAFKSTEAGESVLFELIKGMMCIDMETGAPTGQPCCFSNQVVIQMTRRPKIVEQKDAVTKQPLYDAQGIAATKTYINTFWDKKILLPEVLTLIGEPETIKAFDSAEAYLAAVENENAMNAMA